MALGGSKEGQLCLIMNCCCWMLEGADEGNSYKEEEEEERGAWSLLEE